MKQKMQGIFIGLILGIGITSLAFAEPIAQTIEVVFNQYRIIINGEDKSDFSNDMKPLNYNGRVYVPLRYIGEALNMDVGWEAASNTIMLDSKTDKTVYLTPTDTVSDTELADALVILRSRLLTAGVSSLKTEMQNGSLVLHAASAELTEETLQNALQKGILQFTDCNGQIILTNADITAAFPCYDDLTQSGILQHYIEICLTQEGKARLTEESTRIAAMPSSKNFIAVTLDGALLTAPFVNGTLDTDRIVITGNFTAQSAKHIASLLTTRPLEISFTVQ